MRISLTNQGLIALSRLEGSVRRQYGKRHHLSDQNSLLSLLKLAANSEHETIQAALSRFVAGLPERDQRQLEAAGLQLDAPPLLTQVVD